MMLIVLCTIFIISILTFYIWPRMVRVHIAPGNGGSTIVAGVVGRGDSRAADDLEGLRIATGGAAAE